MNLGLLLTERGPAVVRYALSGAGGGFGRTLLAQTLRMESVRPALLCDLDTTRVTALLHELGYDPATILVCADAAAVAAAPDDAIVIVATPELLDPERYDVLVEGTGSPAAGYRMAHAALTAGRDVAMVSKEVDSVVGVSLARVALENDVVYTPADGDQPANLLGLVSWVRTLGLDIVAAGKSGEYDVVVDPASDTISYLDTTIPAGELTRHLTLGEDVAATLAARAEAVSSLKLRAAADPCEMSVVATHGGFVPDTERLHYPLARISELADVYALKADGGILDDSGVVDVFSVLRRPDEASFAGGVFVVVRTHDAETWKVLEGKGHVVSRNGRYACLYLPYHVMGVETPFGLLTTVRLRVPAGSRTPSQTTVMAGRALADLPAGHVLHMGGHHVEFAGVDPFLLPAAAASSSVAPFYLAAHCTLARPVAAGQVITIDDLADYDASLWEAHVSGRAA
jgi:predicted homoserine dehydrogenase-like protein